MQATGFAGGCNRGFTISDGADIVACLNPDVIVEPGCLATAVQCLERHPGAGAVAPRLMRPDGRTVDSVGQLLRPLTLEVRDRGYGRPLTDDLLAPVPVLSACGALAVYRREALEEASELDGPWAERFFCFWEDLELGWRLHNLGWEVWTCPDAVATHRRGAGAAPGVAPLRWRRPARLEACVLTNRRMTFARHLPALDLLPRLPLLLPWDVGTFVVGAVRRPALLWHVARRVPLVAREWAGRSKRPRRRLRELPC